MPASSSSSNPLSGHGPGMCSSSQGVGQLAAAVLGPPSISVQGDLERAYGLGWGSDGEDDAAAMDGPSAGARLLGSGPSDLEVYYHALDARCRGRLIYAAGKPLETISFFLQYGWMPRKQKNGVKDTVVQMHKATQGAFEALGWEIVKRKKLLDVAAPGCDPGIPLKDTCE